MIFYFFIPRFLRNVGVILSVAVYRFLKLSEVIKDEEADIMPNIYGLCSSHFAIANSKQTLSQKELTASSDAPDVMDIPGSAFNSASESGLPPNWLYILAKAPVNPAL